MRPQIAVQFVSLNGILLLPSHVLEHFSVFFQDCYQDYLLVCSTKPHLSGVLQPTLQRRHWAKEGERRERQRRREKEEIDCGRKRFRLGKRCLGRSDVGWIDAEDRERQMGRERR